MRTENYDNPLYAYILRAEEEQNNVSFAIGLKIINVIFNDPATIVFWNDGTKTVVKANGEPFDEEKGLAMAFAKKALGNKGNYNNVFRKWCK